MAQQINLYVPDVKVTLYKTIGRQTLDGSTPVSPRVIATNHTIDLTPFLGESGSMRVSKSVREAAGGFSLTLTDKPYSQAGSFESLYGLIEPMDMIEIRVQHGVARGASVAPVYMRGFVSEVQRNESMGAGGRPLRTVTISGQDYGKLWQMLQIKYLPGYVIGENLLSGFKLYERFGYGFTTTLSAPQFIEQSITNVVAPFLFSLLPPDSPMPAWIKFDVSVTNGVVDVGGVQNQQGTMFSLMSYFGDVGFWNELYLEDREDGVYCVYRPNPTMDIKGNFIQPDAPVLTPIDVPGSDLISLSLSRSDAGVANYYWVRAPRFEMSDDIYRQQFALQNADKPTIVLDQYANSAVQFYGMRLMDTETQQGGNDVTTMNSGLPADQQATRTVSMVDWIDNRRALVVAQNKDNVLFETGSARIRANEKIRAGCYVRIVRGAFSSTFYVPRVDLDFIPYQGLFQTLTLERGTGFINRVASGGATTSPYLQEMTSVA
jgi:hypothetical protein